MNPKVSLIIPVYNVSAYLDKCFESIVIQTFDNFEAIVINDGSTDNSGDICNKWASKDIRIQVIHKENGGVAQARNIGIQKAKGEYVYFIDPDDYITKNTLDDNYTAAKKSDCDIVIFGYRKESSLNNKVIISETPLFNVVLNTKQDIELSLSNLLDKGARFSIWNKFFKLEFLLGNKILFPSFKRGQDIHFTINAFKHAGSIVVNKGVYYVQNAFFSIAKFDEHTVEHHAVFFENFYNIIEKNNNSEPDFKFSYKLFALWFFHVIPNSVLRNTNFNKSQKLVYLDAIFTNEFLSVYLKDIDINKVKNIALKVALTILKLKNSKLLYLVTKLKIFGMEKLDNGFIAKLYKK